jgi:integrase/recombinase XerD
MPVTLKVIISDYEKEDGTRQVLLRATVDRITRKPGLGIFVIQQDFNPAGTYHKQNWIRTRNKRHAKLNEQIKRIIDRTLDHIARCQDLAILITPASVREIIEKVVRGDDGEAEQISFSAFFQQVMESYLPNQVGTYGLYKTAFDRLKEFAGEDIQFHQLDDSFVSGFFKWLTVEFKSKKGKKPVAVSSANEYLSKLKAVVERAKKTIVMVDGKRAPLMRQENDPFLNYRRVRALEPQIEILDPDEIILFEQAPLKPGTKIWHARNVFLMQYYMAGSRISDILLLTWAKIEPVRAEYYSLKTKNLHSIKIHDKITYILSLYNKKAEGFIFPFFEDGVDYSDPDYFQIIRKRKVSSVNGFLKKIAKKVGIAKNIHSHVSRHSFTSASILAETPIFNVSKAIGHSKVSTTEQYTNRITRTVSDRAMDSVFKKIVVESLPEKLDKPTENSDSKQ